MKYLIIFLMCPLQETKALDGEHMKTDVLLHFALKVVDAKLAFNQAIAAGVVACIEPVTLHLSKPAIKNC